MQRYSYQGIEKIKVLISEFAGILGFVFSTSAAIYILFGIYSVPKSSVQTTLLNNPKVTLICFAFWFLIVGWTISIALLNLMPTIWINEYGLYISSNLFFKIKIPWSNIIDIGSGNPPFSYTLVRARKITIYHRIYGWLYSRTLYPSFLIGKSISGRDELITYIKLRLHDLARREIK